eukprot:CAMPEP_0113461490 /NCGR_PEP_ID=MMETSP0014_2-20120614/11572_1 /TAXON_ID=2857 /ORGANISM="Nitzschia sp." /LENGTH=719 /DNA_ID=CAMNT_0000353261 /DNA_START=880 /DNA_END=3039 /DNA_ORIENTATION=+ /assembly_acc=CAM_ASM_000159
MNKEEQEAAAAAEAKKAHRREQKRINQQNRRDRLLLEEAEAKAKKKAANAYLREWREMQRQRQRQRQQKLQQSNMSSPSSASSSSSSSSAPSSPAPPSQNDFFPPDLQKIAAPGAKMAPEQTNIIQDFMSVQKEKFAFEKQESERRLEKEKQKTRELDVKVETEKRKAAEAATKLNDKQADAIKFQSASKLNKSQADAIKFQSASKLNKSQADAVKYSAKLSMKKLSMKNTDVRPTQLFPSNADGSDEYKSDENNDEEKSLSDESSDDDEDYYTTRMEDKSYEVSPTKATKPNLVKSVSFRLGGDDDDDVSAMTGDTPAPSPKKPNAKSSKAVNLSPPTKKTSKVKATQKAHKALTVPEGCESVDSDLLAALHVKKSPAKANLFKAGAEVTVDGEIGFQFKIVKILDDGTKYKLTYTYPKSENGKPYPDEVEEAVLFRVPVTPISDDDENFDPNDDDEKVDPNFVKAKAAAAAAATTTTTPAKTATANGHPPVKKNDCNQWSDDEVEVSKSNSPSKKAPADIGEPKEGDSLESFFETSTGLTFSVGDKVICFVGNAKCVASITGMVADKVAGDLTALCDLKIISPKSKAGTTSADAGTLSKYEGEDDTADDDENVDPNVVKVKTTTPAKTATAKKPVKSTKTPAKKPVKTKAPAKTATAKKTTMTPAKKVSPIKTTAKSTKSTTIKKKTLGKKAASTSTTSSSTTTTRSTRPRRTCTMK